MARWPEPADLVAAGAGEAVRAWGRLGYPRRALRLHAAAATIVDEHAGVVPERYDDLLALPGIGDYTAAAVASFAYGRRHVVLDTNVRRVLARIVGGQELPPPSLNRPERDRAAALLPDRRDRGGDVGGGHHGARRGGVHRRRPGLPPLPGGGPVRLAPGRLPARRRAGAARPDLRGHRPAVPRPAARGAARGRRPGPPHVPRGGLARRRPRGAAGAEPAQPARRRPGGRRWARTPSPCRADPRAGAQVIAATAPTRSSTTWACSASAAQRLVEQQPDHHRLDEVGHPARRARAGSRPPRGGGPGPPSSGRWPA